MGKDEYKHFEVDVHILFPGASVFALHSGNELQSNGGANPQAGCKRGICLAFIHLVFTQFSPLSLCV